MEIKPEHECKVLRRTVSSCHQPFVKLTNKCNWSKSVAVDRMSSMKWR